MQEPLVSIFSGRATRYLADEIAKHYGKPLGQSSVWFSPMVNSNQVSMKTSVEEMSF